MEVHQLEWHALSLRKVKMCQSISDTTNAAWDSIETGMEASSLSVLFFPWNLYQSSLGKAFLLQHNAHFCCCCCLVSFACLFCFVFFFRIWAWTIIISHHTHAEKEQPRILQNSPQNCSPYTMCESCFIPNPH